VTLVGDSGLEPEKCLDGHFDGFGDIEIILTAQKNSLFE
jgi:hypothetical protein